MKQSILCRLGAFLCLFCLLPVWSPAQLLRDTSITVTQLSPTQKARYDTIKANTHYNIDGETLLTWSNLSEVNVDGKFDVSTSLSTCDATVEYTVSHLDYESNSNYTLVATAISDDTVSSCFGGTLWLSVENGVYYGQFTYNGRDYEILDLGDNVLLLLLKNLNGISCTMLEKTNPFTIVPPQPEGCISCKVGIMVLYTPKAAYYFTNVLRVSAHNFIKGKIALYNVAAQQSSHMSDYPEVVLKHYGLLSGFDEDIFLRNDTLLTKIANNPTVQSKRNQYNADIVGLIIARQTIEGSAGVAWGGINGKPAPREAAFHSTNIWHDQTHIHSHEIAHNIGAHHEDEPAISGNRAASMRHGFLHAYTSHTAVWRFPGKRVAHFSNPNINYKGWPTGSPTRYNFWHMNNNRCAVAAYRGTPNNVVFLRGPYYKCPYESVTIMACEYYDLFGFYGRWFKSTDGINYIAITPAGPQTSVTLTMPPLEGYKLYVKLEFYKGNDTLARYHVVQASSAVNGLPCTLKKEYEASSKGYALKIYPNPTQGVLNLGFINPLKDALIKYEITDLTGALIMQDHFMLNGNTFKTLSIEKLGAGLYMLRTRMNDQTKITKFVVQ